MMIGVQTPSTERPTGRSPGQSGQRSARAASRARRRADGPHRNDGDAVFDQYPEGNSDHGGTYRELAAVGSNPFDAEIDRLTAARTHAGQIRRRRRRLTAAIQHRKGTGR